MRFVAVDWGETRIGLAAGEVEFGAVRPLSNLAASGSLQNDAKAISRVAEAENAEAIVVGLPRNPLGPDRMERICQQLSERIRELGLLVFTVDETLSSREAESQLAENGIKSAARKKLLDGEAAARILTRYFAEKRESAKESKRG